MTETGGSDWYYMVAIVLGPILFIAVMAYAVMRSAKGRKGRPVPPGGTPAPDPREAGSSTVTPRER